MNLPRQKIADGIYANFIEGEKFKVHAITLSIQLPLNIETVTMANLLSRVLRRGCTKYPDMKSLEKRLDELYAADLSLALTRSGEAQYFCLSADFLSDNYTENCDIIKEIVSVMREVLLFPKIEGGAFDNTYVSGEKKNLCDDIDSLINNKAKYAKSRLIEELCRGEAYAVSTLGDKAVLSGITSEKLYEFHLDILKHNRMEIFYTGDKNCFDKVCSELSLTFEGLVRSYNENTILTEVKYESGNLREVYEDMEVNQGKLAIGLRTGITNTDPDIAALIVANEIYGSSPNSKLFMNVREKMSLCYYCSSALDAVKGIMLVNAGIEGQNFEVAKKAIFEQLDNVKNSDFTDEEFSSAINSLINGYKSVYDSVSSLEAWYLPRVFRGEKDTAMSRIDQIKKVTRDDIVRAAKKINPEVVYFLRPTVSGKEEM